MQAELSTLQNLVNTATSFLVQYGFQIVGAIIILIVGFKLAAWLAGIVTTLCERRSIDVTLVRFFANIARVVTLAFVIIIAMGKFGLSIAPLIAALGAVAFGSSLALQGPLSNYGAGISIILGRPFVVGNTITVQGVSGVVHEVRLAATVLRTEDGEEITIPNKQVVGEILLNSFANRVVETDIAISYDDDPDRTVALFASVLADFEGVTASPAPQIGIARFADSGIAIGLRYWVPTVRYFEIQYAVNHALYRAIKEAGITIPYPRSEVALLHADRAANPG